VALKCIIQSSHPKRIEREIYCLKKLGYPFPFPCHTLPFNSHMRKHTYLHAHMRE